MADRNEKKRKHEEVLDSNHMEPAAKKPKIDEDIDSRGRTLQLLDYDDSCHREVFFEILDALRKEWKAAGKVKGFYCNREWLLDAFITKSLYVICDLSFDELPENKYRSAKPTDVGPILTGWHIPAFCVKYKDSDQCSLIWVRQDFRLHGYGKFFVEKLKIVECQSVRESTVFWGSCGFDIVMPPPSRYFRPFRNIIPMRKSDEPTRTQ